MPTLRMVALATVLLAGLAAPALAQDKVLRIWHTETEPQTIKAFNMLAVQSVGSAFAYSQKPWALQ